jgi:FPC/CPF motif-containing protein YcgG
MSEVSNPSRAHNRLRERNAPCPLSDKKCYFNEDPFHAETVCATNLHYRCVHEREALLEENWHTLGIISPRKKREFEKLAKLLRRYVEKKSRKVSQEISFNKL